MKIPPPKISPIIEANDATSTHIAMGKDKLEEPNRLQKHLVPGSGLCLDYGWMPASSRQTHANLGV